jgi:hypothetical protein
MWKGVNPTRAELDEFIVTWKQRVLKAIRTIENRARAKKNKLPLDSKCPIRFPGRDGTPAPIDICLLNFRTWMLRYGVSVEFQISALRQVWPKRYRIARKSTFYLLSLSPRALTTVAARKHIEQAVIEAYPGGEQWRTNSAAGPSPRTRLDPMHPEAFVRRYRAKIARLREQQDVLEERRRHLRRNYRKPELTWRTLINESSNQRD